MEERFTRLGPITAVARVLSGSPATFILRLSQGRAVTETIDGAPALVPGAALLHAKRTMEEMLATGWIFVDLPMVEDAAIPASDLAWAGDAEAGVIAALVDPPQALKSVSSASGLA